jgi:hypothetical protein
MLITTTNVSSGCARVLVGDPSTAAARCLVGCKPMAEPCTAGQQGGNEHLGSYPSRESSSWAQRGAIRAQALKGLGDVISWNFADTADYIVDMTAREQVEKCE